MCIDENKNSFINRASCNAMRIVRKKRYGAEIRCTYFSVYNENNVCCLQKSKHKLLSLLKKYISPWRAKELGNLWQENNIYKGDIWITTLWSSISELLKHFFTWCRNKLLQFLNAKEVRLKGARAREMFVMEDIYYFCNCIYIIENFI